MCRTIKSEVKLSLETSSQLSEPNLNYQVRTKIKRPFFLRSNSSDSDDF